MNGSFVVYYSTNDTYIYKNIKGVLMKEVIHVIQSESEELRKEKFTQLFVRMVCMREHSRYTADHLQKACKENIIR